MTAEQRLDRLERIVMMFVRSGVRARSEMNEKISMLIDSQVKTDDRFAKFDERCAKYDALFAMYSERFAKFDERFAKYDERFTRFDERFAISDERFAKNDERLRELGARTDKTLEILMALLKERQNGRSDHPNEL